jgi:hypothetical protein
VCFIRIGHAPDQTIAIEKIPSGKYDRFVKGNRTGLAVWGLILAFLALACANAFIQDDAFISFRYAENLVNQGELTWNPGEPERVEGYTNFLWVLLLSAPAALGIDLILASKVLGLLFFVLSCFLTYRLGLVVFQSTWWALLAMTFVGTNYTFSAYATGGLETQLQALLITAAVYVTLRAFMKGVAPTRRSLLGLSAVCLLALLTRLDSAIPVAVLCFYVLSHAPKHRASTTAFLILPVLLILGLWHVWKWTYYGDLFPNTFYAKATYFSWGVWRAGLVYVYAFVQSYLLIPFLFLAIVFRRHLTARAEMAIPLAIVLLWCAYTIAVGGDFMEFRQLVPILPLALILVTRLIRALPGRPVQTAFTAMVFAGSLHHAATFEGIGGIESIGQLDAWVTDENQGWRRAGVVLNEMFAATSKPVTIATTAAGAIPYYSRLPAIDMHGLNDRWIARHAPVVRDRPGHQREPTLEYLIDRGTNLVLGHPLIEPKNVVASPELKLADLARFRIEDARAGLLPKESTVLEIPLSSDYKMTVLYLHRHDHIDRIIRERKLTTINIRR